MQIIIPMWFYGFDATLYLISALIGFLLSFYFYRMYSISSEKGHLYLHTGFLLLSIGLLALSITDTFSYVISGFPYSHISFLCWHMPESTSNPQKPLLFCSSVI